MSSAKWWRVIDPLNPLYGCDVTLRLDDTQTYYKLASFDEDCGGGSYASVTGLRRLDVLLGDRPYQLIRPDGDVGILINVDHIEESPIQDDVVEIGYDLPNGKCLDEVIERNGDDDELRIVRYEKAIQVAYGEQEGELFATCTLKGDDREAKLAQIIEAYYDAKVDFDDMTALIKREGR